MTDMKVMVVVKKDGQTIKGFMNLDSASSEVIEDMKVNRKYYIGKVIMNKEGKLFKILNITDKGLDCEPFTMEMLQ